VYNTYCAQLEQAFLKQITIKKDFKPINKAIKPSLILKIYDHHFLELQRGYRSDREMPNKVIDNWNVRSRCCTVLLMSEITKPVQKAIKQKNTK
jgi:hypothetical protein